MERSHLGKFMCGGDLAETVSDDEETHILTHAHPKRFTQSRLKRASRNSM